MRVEMRDIYKSFGQNEVLKGVNLTINDGEIHALMGENGAGKSTLMNILSGLLKADQGETLIDGQVKNYHSILDSEKDGIAFVHQELNIFDDLTLLENLFMNKEYKNKFGFINKVKMQEKADELMNQLSLSFDMNSLGKDNSVGNKQMVEIMKALLVDAKLIIMDEPTAALSDRECEILFKVLNQLKAKGVSIIYISHRMEEIFSICDKITTMRDGKTISTYDVKQVDKNQIVKEMVGRELNQFYPNRDVEIGETVLDVKKIHNDVVDDVKFKVRKGEIIGIAGLMGAGRSETMRALFGLDQAEKELYLEDKQVTINKPKDAINLKIGFVTEDRKNEGLILGDSIAENIILPNIDRFAPKGLLKSKLMDEYSETLAKRLKVKMLSVDDLCEDLSGGNQQKVVLAKWIGMGLKVLILDEPTRGIDVGAKAEIYKLMNQLCEYGLAIIMVSSDLEEVLGMSDRIYVMHEGSIKKEFSKEEATQEKIMQVAIGG